MFIADAQVHIWAPPTPERPWRPGHESHRPQPLGADELLREMGAAGIHRAILISPFWDGPRNDVVLEAARSHPDAEAFRDLDKLLALAKRPNVAVKWSALPTFTTDTYPYRVLHPYLRRVYDAFGPQRIFWGTDLARLPCFYRQAVTMVTEEIPWLTTEDKQWIMGRGVCEWLRWALPANYQALTQA